jgi:hypothetical protein
MGPAAACHGACQRENDRMTAPESDRDEDTGDRHLPTYSYKPSLMGAPSRFTLERDALHWQISRYSGRIRYDQVTCVRMSYRPATIQTHRFVAEIWSPGHPKIQFASSSWRSIAEQERFDASYVAFVAELHRRLATAGTKAQFLTGMPVFSYWVGVIVFAAAILAMAALAVRAMQLGEWSAAGVIGALLLVFAYQLGQYFRRNLPGRYRPDAPPAHVLPQRR